MKLVISADKHTRQDAPYRKAISQFFHWYASNQFNSKDSIHIDLGDFYHRARPTPLEYQDGRAFLSKLEGKKILLAGNHDYDYSEDLVHFSLQPHYQDPDIEIIAEPTIKTFGNLRCLFLPWKYNFDGVSRKEFYEKIFPSQIENQTFDFIFYHFGDETVAFGKGASGIDLSAYHGKRIGGDIHVTKSLNYLQVPIPTRKDEAGHRGKIMVVDCETREIEYLSVPQYLDFFIIKYGDEPKKNLEGECVHYIIDAPSFEAAEEKYKNINLGGISLKKFSIQGETTEESEQSDFSLDMLREQFFEEKKTAPEVREVISRAFSKPSTI